MITADGQGYAPESGDDAPEGPPTPPYGMARATGTPRPYAPPRRPAEPELEPEDDTDRARILREDRTARTERMIWRNVFLGLYVLGLVLYAVWALTREGTLWNLTAFVVLLLGGLGPGLFLVAREQGEREVEHNRSRPEPRHDGELPGLRRPVGMSYPDDVLDGR